MSGKARANGEGSIYPYKGGYAAYVWVTDSNGLRKRKYVYGREREEVHGKWIELMRKAKEGPVATKTPTVASYLAYWLRDVIEPNRSPATYANYEMFARLYIVPGLGDKHLDRLKVSDVQKWINKVAATCQCCAQGKDERRPAKLRRCCARGRCCGEYISARTLSDVRNCLRSALSHARDADELLSKNAAAPVKLPPIRKRRGKAWSTEEARRFLESARQDGDPLYAAYVLTLVLGLRRGEVLGLTWDDVDVDGEELSVAFQLQRIRGRLYHRETKTEASDATLPFPSICTTALQLRQEAQNGAKSAAGHAWHESRLVFTTRLGTPIEPRNFNRSFHARCEAAGVRRIKVHDARRTCASLLADLDVHPRVAMQILRHADFDITMEVYTQVSSKKTRDALKRLSESLGEC
ncbi:site-specific integrase [Actinocatenispora sera]|uniref:Site-specific integrase n=1 Tax=Actinocatenispora sera TaxID=390989 RepID=A0A810KU62_9ACTN|nr:site-specific integrase [Actinocatenispora sera]BCJ26195.1 site-specific integrase [Actinocatenispora sera]